MAVRRYVKCHRLLPRRIAIKGQADGPAAHSETSEGRHNPQAEYEGLGRNTSFRQGWRGNKTVLWLANQQLRTHETGAGNAAVGTAAATDAR